MKYYRLIDTGISKIYAIRSKRSFLEGGSRTEEEALERLRMLRWMWDSRSGKAVKVNPGDGKFDILTVEFCIMTYKATRDFIFDNEIWTRRNSSLWSHGRDKEFNIPMSYR